MNEDYFDGRLAWDERYYNEYLYYSVKDVLDG